MDDEGKGASERSTCRSSLSLAHLSPAHLLGSVVSSLRSSSNRTERREPDERRRASLTGRKVRRPQTAEEVTDGGRERSRLIPSVYRVSRYLSLPVGDEGVTEERPRGPPARVSDG